MHPNNLDRTVRNAIEEMEAWPSTLHNDGMKHARFSLASLVLLAIAALPVSPAFAQEWNVRFSMCGRDRVTCVVDGDTIWLEGHNLRLQSFDTPEPHNDICGGAREVALAKQASARLLDLLNGNAFTVETAGEDRYGRTLATIRIQGRDVGDILISEGLARKWPNGREFWC
jgi:micrococcal nuclease